MKNPARLNPAPGFIMTLKIPFQSGRHWKYSIYRDNLILRSGQEVSEWNALSPKYLRLC